MRLADSISNRVRGLFFSAGVRFVHFPVDFSEVGANDFVVASGGSCVIARLGNKVGNVYRPPGGDLTWWVGSSFFSLDSTKEGAEVASKPMSAWNPFFALRAVNFSVLTATRACLP
jgi:hypothetical protein